MILIANSYHHGRGGKIGLVARPRKTFGITLFLSQEGSLCDKEKVPHKDTFVYSLKRTGI